MNHERNSIPNFTTLRQSKLIIFPVLSLSPSPFLNFPFLALFANNCSEISNIRVLPPFTCCYSLIFSNIINRNYDESRS
ncbi:hypothetical protein L2E82_35528 [Cichorium intybus]|uniref:Uncharacterized protein n=1 Tax=Cichorium intybus TaxID=13427 RepID=A0ACB9BP15_CICIN|nr:hypothetical protein L2E82_35528 [Cichorium intybus]